MHEGSASWQTWAAHLADASASSSWIAAHTYSLLCGHGLIAGCTKRSLAEMPNPLIWYCTPIPRCGRSCNLFRMPHHLFIKTESVLLFVRLANTVLSAVNPYSPSPRALYCSPISHTWGTMDTRLPYELWLIPDNNKSPQILNIYKYKNQLSPVSLHLSLSCLHALIFGNPEALSPRHPSVDWYQWMYSSLLPPAVQAMS